MALDFETFSRTGRPNDSLVAPAGLCAGAAPDRDSPRFSHSADVVREAFLAMAKRQKRTRVLEETPRALELVQRSLVLRFPDYVSVCFIDLEGGESTLAIYSRAKYGYSDFNVNRSRVESWLDQLADALGD